MKTLEIEAALDTAEETRKKIVELTSEKQKVINVCLFFLISVEGAGWPDCEQIDAQT